MASVSESNRSLDSVSVWKSYLPRRPLLESIGSVVSTIIIVTFAVSFAGLIFAGDLEASLPIGIGLGLISAVVLSAFAAGGGSFTGLTASPQDKPAAIIGVAVASVASTVSTDQILPTVLVYITLTSVIFGATLFVGGYLRLGGFIRYLPYPVIGGFLAGTGCLILLGAFTFLGVPLQVDDLGGLWRDEYPLRWVPAAVFGALLYIAQRRSNHFLILPGFIAVGIVLSYLLLEYFGLAGTEAGSDFVIGHLPDTVWSPEIALKQIPDADWGFILSNLPTICAIVLVSLVAMLLNETGIEVATRRHMDFNRDMRCMGLANIVLGSGGGLAGYSLLGLSILNHKLDVSTKFVGLATAALIAVVLFYGLDLIALFPRWVVGGILFFLAIDFLVEWLVDSRRIYSVLDFTLVVFITICIVSLGILEGVGLGIVIMAIVFVFNYSRIGAINSELTGSTQRSNVQRSPMLEKFLSEKGDRIVILELQGYLFFGSAHRILERIVDKLEKASDDIPDFIVLDFRRVDGADSSAVLSFLKMRHLAQEHGFVIVFTHVSEQLVEQLRRGDCLTDDEVCVVFQDLDRGIEWCENQMLAEAEEKFRKFGLPQLLVESFSQDQLPRLQNHLVRMDLETGSIVFRQGEAADGMYFVESGSVSVVLDLESDNPVRLRKFGGGTIVGEMAVYTQEPRSASVRVEDNAVLYHLPNDAMSGIEREEPDLASAFHRYIVRVLSDRLTHTNKTLYALRH